MGELIKREAAANPLSFSGERLTSATSGQVEIEHYHRYLLAREFCRGRDVLDIAAGEGYGTALLAQVAASAVGVEIDGCAVAAARREFARPELHPNLRFEQGDARAIPLGDASVDVVVSFETLEHLAEQDLFLSEIRRVLREGGLLVISTPDRDVYSPLGQEPNPYHVLELTRAEFEGLLARFFANVAVAAQRPLIGSVIMGAGGGALRSYERRSESLIEGSDGLPRAPYLIALASAAPLPALPDSVFVYRNDLDTDPRVRAEAERARGLAEQAAREAGEQMEAALGHVENARHREAEQAAQGLMQHRRAEAAEAALVHSEADAEARIALVLEQGVQLTQLMSLVATRQERAEHRAAQAGERAAVAERRATAAEEALHGLQPAHVEAQARAGDFERRWQAEWSAHDQALQRERHVQHRLESIESSTAWKLTHHARSLGERFPVLARRLRLGTKLVWWTASMQLPRRYGLWRRNTQMLLGAPVADSTIAIEQAVIAAPDATSDSAPTAAPVLPVVAEAPIRLVLARDPVVSVIIPTYGQVAATLACLRSFAAHPPHCGIEVIVVDDAYAGPEDLGPLHAVEGIVLLRNPENLGYLRSCNEAVRRARGAYVHLLNNDTEIRPGAVDALLALLRSRPDAGMAGSKLVYPDGRLQEAGGILWQDGSGWNYGRGEDAQNPDYTFVRETDYCSAASVMIARPLWDLLGGFDELFLPAYYEDADLAFRVREAGLAVLYEPRSEVVHHEGASHGTDLGCGIKAAQVVNQAKMLGRWGDTLRREHYANGEHVLRAATRSRHRKTALVIDHYVPEPDRDAGSRSALGIMASMLDAGWIVKLWPHNRAYSGAYTTDLEAMGIEVLDHRWPGDLAAWLDRYGNDLDHVMAIRPDIAVAAMPHLLQRTDAVLSFYGVDLHFARLRRQADLGGDAQVRRDALMVETQERRVWRTFDVVLYPSEEEAAAVRAMAPNVLARGIVPFCFDAEPARTAPPPERTILFVAGFAHPPNVDAALFLINDIIPRLEAEIGPVKVTLAGSKPSAAVRALAGRDVEVTGYITDEALDRLYDSHRVAVVPLRFGAGVKGKVVESLAHGLPVVTTSVGAQGIDGLDQVVPVRDEPTAIVAVLKALLMDDAAWVAQSARQVAFAQARFSRAAMGRSVIAALEAGEAARIEHPHDHTEGVVAAPAE